MTSYFHIANRLSLCLIFTACCVIAHSAVAEEDVGRWYGSLGLGWNYAKPIEIDDTGGVIDYDFGLPAASFALGFRPVEHWRVELEVSHQENKPEILYFPGSDVEIDTVQSDALKTTSFMMSAIRDFNLGIAFRPYLGVGAGTANIRSKFTAGDSAGEEFPIIDDETWAFAYQGMVGLTVPVSRSLTLAMEYRYWQAPSPDLEDLAGNAVDGRQTIHSGWFRLNYQPGGYAWNPETVARHPRPEGGRFYVGGSFGGGWATDRDLLGRSGQLDAFSIGPMASAAVGYRLGRRWRLELEGARRRNDMQIFDTFYDESRTTGDVRADSLAINAVYRFRPDAAVNPFIGAGAGIARLRYNLDLATDGSDFISDEDSTDSTHMFQILLGFDVALTPRWTVMADYRMWLSGKVTITPGDTEPVEVTHFVHSMTFGIRYAFDD
jgi:opacity protein-like surface antigen